MIIVGAGGHAREILDLLEINEGNCYFFDNITEKLPQIIAGIEVIQTEKRVRECFKKDNRFILGTGSSAAREKLFKLMSEYGGRPHTLIAHSSFVSPNVIKIGEGVNIMSFAFVSSSVIIGIGCLINARVNLHHDVEVGNFCEIGPGAILLGGVQVGSRTLIGSGAIVLPKVTIGNNCKIGAGAVVTKNVEDNTDVIGIPAVPIKASSVKKNGNE